MKLIVLNSFQKVQAGIEITVSITNDKVTRVIKRVVPTNAVKAYLKRNPDTASSFDLLQFVRDNKVFQND